MEYIEVQAQEAFLITNIINEMFHCMDQGKLFKTISGKVFIKCEAFCMINIENDLRRLQAIW